MDFRLDYIYYPNEDLNIIKFESIKVDIMYITNYRQLIKKYL